MVVYFFVTVLVFIYILLKRSSKLWLRYTFCKRFISSDSFSSSSYANNEYPPSQPGRDIHHSPQLPHRRIGETTNEDLASVFFQSSGPLGMDDTSSTSFHDPKGPTGNVPQQSWEINPKELKFGPRIGTGNVGEVYRGIYRHRTIAIKRLLGNWIQDKDMVHRFREEISLMATMNHPNVLHFIGAVLDYHAGNMCLVTEYCAKGTLYDVLHSNDILPWRIRIKMAWDIAKGMGYLHEQAHIIQRDLKTTNLLVTDHYEVKVADFGLSRIVAPVMETYCGTPATMAPEIVKQSIYDERVDVFSFAIIMWELATRCEPYPGLSGLQLAMTVAHEGLRPPVPAYIPSEWAALMVRAWDTNPVNRPSFDTIQRTLHSMLDTLDEADALIALSMGVPSSTLRISSSLTAQQKISSKRKYYNAIMGKDVVFLNNNNNTTTALITKDDGIEIHGAKDNNGQSKENNVTAEA